MELSEDEIFEKYGKKCVHCNRNRLPTYEYEVTCISLGYNVVIQKKKELSKVQQKKIEFFNRLKYAEHKIFCICIDVYKIYDGSGYDKTYEVLSRV